MQEMRRPPRLQKRRHRFFCRVSVPVEVRPVVGRTEIVRTLGTGDYREALKRLPLVSAEIDAEFALARRRLSDERSEPDNFTLKQAVLLWFRRAAHRESAGSPEHALTRDQAVVESRDVLAQLLDPDDPGTLAAAQRVVSSIVADGALVIEPRSPAWWTLVGYVQRAIVEQARRSVDRLHGDHSERSHDALFREPRPGEPVVPADGLTLGRLVEEYLDDPRQRALAGKTRAERRAMLDLLLEVVGKNTPVAEITRAVARRVRDLLIALPPHHRKRWPSTRAERVAALARERGLATMSDTSVNNYLTYFAALMRFAQREYQLQANVFEGLRVGRIGPGPRDRRLPFTIENLQAIFNQDLYTNPERRRAEPARFWAPLVALFGGLRMEEILQLDVADVESRDGVHVIVVRRSEDGTKRVKTDAGERVVPIHVELVKCGFLAFVAERRAAGAVKLFDLPVGPHGSRSHAFSKWYRRFLRGAGITDRRRVFHSLRHNFRDAMSEANMPRDAMLALAGWSSGHTADRYGSGLRPSTLASLIQRIRYPGLDLTHLHVH